MRCNGRRAGSMATVPLGEEKGRRPPVGDVPLTFPHVAQAPLCRLAGEEDAGGMQHARSCQELTLHMTQLHSC